MALAAKLFRHQRRLFPRLLSSPFVRSATLENPTRVPSLLFCDRFTINSNPTLPLDLSSKSFSWFAWNPASDDGGNGSGESVGAAPAGSSEPVSEFNLVGVSQPAAELSNLGFDGSGVVEEAVAKIISLLDWCHEFSGFPWWVIISTSTLALRLSLLPLLILQLRKAQEISLIFPKLPPPFPPPLSGRSFKEQYLLFQQKRRELGCPSFMWNFAFFTVQFPCFLLWMTSVRRMCLDSHPGFDTGGMLWFQNLTDFPSGILGSTFPILVGGLHYVNVQISFQTIKSVNLQGILGLLIKYYKLYLDILSIPLLLIGFHIPQGSLVYWVTNNLVTLFQQLSLRNSFFRMKLGLQDGNDLLRKRLSSENVLPMKNVNLEDEDDIRADAFSPQKLLDVALEDIAAGNLDKAIPSLEVAIKKDPELVRALIAMGQILFSRRSFVYAAEYFENAISKIQDKEDTLLVLATFGAGVSHLWQGNKFQGIEHLKTIAELKEPDSPMDKACYHDSMVILGRTLFEEGQKSEAAKYLRIAAAYNPAVNAFVKQCEEG